MENSLLWNDSLLRQAGMQLLSKHLGLVECERFISLIRREQPFDYTEWRETLFDDMTGDELFEAVRNFERESKTKKETQT